MTPQDIFIECILNCFCPATPQMTVKQKRRARPKEARRRKWNEGRGRSRTRKISTSGAFGSEGSNLQDTRFAECRNPAKNSRRVFVKGRNERRKNRSIQAPKRNLTMMKKNKKKRRKCQGPVKTVMVRMPKTRQKKALGKTLDTASDTDTTSHDSSHGEVLAASESYAYPDNSIIFVETIEDDASRGSVASGAKKQRRFLKKFRLFPRRKVHGKSQKVSH